MIATVYFWSEPTGLLTFDGVEYDAGYREVRSEGSDGQDVIEARPSIRFPQEAIDTLAKSRACADTLWSLWMAAASATHGLLWRFEEGRAVDAIPVVCTSVLGLGAASRRGAGFCSRGPFVLASSLREQAQPEVTR